MSQECMNLNQIKSNHYLHTIYAVIYVNYILHILFIMSFIIIKV